MAGESARDHPVRFLIEDLTSDQKVLIIGQTLKCKLLHFGSASIGGHLEADLM